MVFHSFLFVLVFLPLVVVGHHALLHGRGARFRIPFLLAASITFYACASWQTLPLLAGSLLLNAFLSRRVVPGDDDPGRRRWLFAGIALNVLVLFVLKYTVFTFENVESLTGIRVHVPAFALPLGISFFTLQQIVWLVDCYEGLAKPVPLARQALVLSFFPTISAGPIVRARDLFAQLDEPTPAPRFDAGLARFIVGLGKKVLLADLCGRLVDPVFGTTLPVGLIDGWLAALAYTMQLYFDFSGYCDMAIGVGWMLGVRLPENFDAPLRSASVVEFWTRWHVTLSKFITTYLYTPLLKSFLPVTFPKAMFATVVVMGIAGIWHGPAWTFVVYGLAHGLALVVNHLWRKRKRKIPRALAQALTLGFLVSAFVVFRASSLPDAGHVLAGMYGLGGVGSLRSSLEAVAGPDLAISLVSLAVACGTTFAAPSTTKVFEAFRPSALWVAACSLLLVAALIGMNASASKGFIYRGF